MEGSTATQQPKICVIIASHNFEPWMDVCIPSALRSSIPVTVLVVDNASSDNTCNRIKSDYPDVLLFENKQNLGFGQANNIGLKYAIAEGFDDVFLLNQDATIETDTLEILVSEAQKRPHLGIISPVHLNGRGDSFDFGFKTYTKLSDLQDLDQLSDDPVECPFINAALWLIPIDVIKLVGGFAPIFPHYGEDVNYAQRVRFHGYKTGFVKSAKGCHFRENREISPAQFFYAEYIYFLSESVNPFHSLFKAFAYSIMAALKKATSTLLKGNFRAFSEYTSIVFRLAGKTKRILKTRTQSIRRNRPFL
ncbi:MAG: glycosyltransferase family 2 protein [Dysgonamonadaceae bacterium]|jgi:GT2 family glycosyltransferase|nr:glycosyltransferase family 2 protein [Dysgonamonadaceae bacterium]